MFLLSLAVAAQASGPVFSTLLSGGGQEFATAVTSDSQSNSYVAGLTYSPDFPVTAGAYQTTFGQTCDAFIAKVGPDGKVIWATYLGGILDDWATGVALDASGNVWVTGYTRSPNFPLVNPIQTNYTGFETFVAKFDPTGSKLLYSTVLSGAGETGGAGIVLDAAGNVYIASNTYSAAAYPGSPSFPNKPGIVVSKLTAQGTLAYSYFYPYGIAGGIAVDSSGAVYVAGTYSPFDTTSPTKVFGSSGLTSAMIFKLSPNGSTKLYDTALGGAVQSAANGIAVASTGEVWVAGSTSSADFPLVHPLQSSLGSRPLWKSTNSGASWTPLDSLPFALPQMLIADPTTPNTLYVATADLGLFKSLDGGATWAQSSKGIASPNVQAVAINPSNPQILYAATIPPVSATSSLVYKSTDGAATWTQVDAAGFLITQLAVDPQNPNNVYEAANNSVYNVGANIRRSTDAGATWSAVTLPVPTTSFALDPRVSGAVLAVTQLEVSGPGGAGINVSPTLYRSVDGGTTFTANQSFTPNGLPGLVIDGSTNPSTVYDGLAFRSTDGGVTWSALRASPASTNTSALAVDSSGTLYAANSTGLYTSHDHGQTWTAIGSPANPNVNAIVPVGSSGTLYASMKTQTGFQANSLGISIAYNLALTFQGTTAGFLSKLSADGATLQYSTYLRGHSAGQTSSILISEPNDFQTQGWISGVALDAAGDIVVAGGTRSTDFPTANPVQAANAGLTDAFATVLSPDGSKITYSTYFGGSLDDGALAMGLDPQGNILLAGQTFSGDFPVPGASTAPFSYGNAFLTKLAPPPAPVITSVLSAASYQPAIAAASWVMIKGTGLANTNPGRTWATPDFNSVNLPTALDGVSVTIDGIAAFVEYISPTQINVLAPADSALGNVNIVVDNNGALSAAATAPYQPLAPAFFLYGATNDAVASRLPAYAPVGNPSAPANPGDTLVLWGSGFGATNPPTAPSVTVSGAPVVIPTPTVTVGGMSVPVISAVMTSGSAGLYQITIQLPANVPTGSVLLQASVGNSQTPDSVMLDIGK
jgi:uncharacterized protein (TIGR03437 family)